MEFTWNNVLMVIVMIAAVVLALVCVIALIEYSKDEKHKRKLSEIKARGGVFPGDEREH